MAIPDPSNYIRVYESGFPYRDKLHSDLILPLIERVKHGFASLVIIDGAQGQGKTTMAIEIMDSVNAEFGLPPVSLKMTDHPQMTMGASQFLKGLRECKERNFPILTYDEAGDYNRRGALTKINNSLNQIFSKFRGLKMILILVLPCFDSLDNWLFDLQIPRALINLHDRVDSYGNFRVYDLNNMNWIKYRMSNLPRAIKHKAYSMQETNFDGHFLDLSMERQLQLDKLSTKQKVDSITKEEINLEGLITMSDVARRTGRSISWVNKFFVMHKIKANRKIKRINYYDNSVIDRVIQSIKDA